VLENERPVLVVKMLVKADTRCRTRHYPFKRGLAHGKRIAPQIIAVQLDQIERPHEHVAIVAAVSDAVEQRDTIGTACNSFPVDNAGPGLQPRERFDNERKSVGQIITGATLEPHALAILPSDHPEAVVLDFV
jgi:hypothetical protein